MHAGIKVIAQNHIFVNVINGTGTKQRFVRNEYHTLDISYILRIVCILCVSEF